MKPHPPTPPVSFVGLISDLALSAVEVQRALRAHHAAALDAVAPSDVVPLDNPVADHIARTAAGPALQVTRSTVTVRTELTRTRELGGQLQVRPLNLGYAVAFGSSTTTTSRLFLELRAVPATASPHPSTVPPPSP